MASYTIQKGDTLSRLAKRFNTTVSALASLNNIRDVNKIYIGDVLRLPEGEAAGAQGSAPLLEEALGSRPAYGESAGLAALAKELSQREAQKPGDYQSPFEERISRLLDEIEGREGFRYDYASDPLYQQYRDSYTREGRLAMLDTMGSAAALTGGYGSSYGSTAGQQAYQGYLARLNDTIPALYEAAYARYRDEGGDLYDRLGLYRGLDSDQYGRYRDSVEDHYAELDYYYNKYSDMSKAEYERYKADLSAWMEDRDFYYQKARDEKAGEAAAAAGKGSGSAGSPSSAKAQAGSGAGSAGEGGGRQGEVQELYSLLEGATPYEREQLYRDESAVAYMRALLGEEGYRELLRRYPA